MAQSRSPLPPSRQTVSREALFCLLDSLEDGITVLGGDNASREVLFENAQARSFRALGRLAPCVKTLAREIEWPTGDTTSSARLEVTSNPATSSVVRQVLEAVPGVTFLANPSNAALHFLSSTWKELTGQPAHEVTLDDRGVEHTSFTWEKSIHPEDREYAVEAWTDAVLNCKSWSADFRLQVGSRVIHMSNRGEYVHNVHGVPFLLAGVSNDVTELVVARERLEQEQSFLSAAIDSVPVGVMVVRKQPGQGSNFPVVFANQETLRLWGSRTKKHTFSDRLSSFGDYEGFHPNGRRVEGNEWPLARSVLYGEVCKDEDYMIRRGDGSEAIVRLNSAPVRDPKRNEIIGGVIASEDVTAKLEAERDRGLREAAEQTSKQMQAMLANVSHEVRTPIAGVIGLASLLSDTPLDDEQKELVEGITESGKLLLVVISDLLDHSKMKAGKLELEKQPFCLHSVIRHVLSLTSEVTRTKGLCLTTRFDPSLPPVLVHSELRLKQVFLNLLSNAAKFTPPGGSITIEGYAELLNERPPRRESAPSSPSRVRDPPATGFAANAHPKSANPSPREEEVRLLLQHHHAAGHTPVATASIEGCAASGPGAPPITINEAPFKETLPLLRLVNEKATAALDSQLPVLRLVSQQSAPRVEATAVQASSTGEGPPPGTWVRLHFSVSDSGIGLTEKQMQRLFKPFMQADSSTTRKYGGTGLGLALCHDLLELMDGKISVASEGESTGTTFSFEFVAQVGDTSEMQCPVRQPPGTFTFSAGHRGASDGDSSASERRGLANLAGAAYHTPVLSKQQPPRGQPRQALALAASSALEKEEGEGRRAQDRGHAQNDSPGLACANPGSKLVSTPPWRTPSSITPSAATGAGNGSSPGVLLASPASRAPSARILLVDDVAVNRAVAKRYLAKLGYKDVVEMCNGAEAVEAVKASGQGQQGPFDIVLMDLMMPVMGGSEATRAIKALDSPPSAKTMPIIALTAAPASERDRFEGLFLQFLTKPFTKEELGEAIASSIGR